MSRYVKVAALSPSPPASNMNLGYDKLVDLMINYWEDKISLVLSDKPDIILLYETSDIYGNFTVEQTKEYYQYRGNIVLDFFKKIAKDNKCYIAYPYVKEYTDDTRRNCICLIDRNGNEVGQYNKNHLLISEITSMNCRCGRDAPVFKCDFGNIAFAICFDLNFRELLNKYKESKPEILFFSSMYHGGFVQKSWAYEIGCYFVSAVAGIECAVLSPIGETVAKSTNYFKHLTTTINLDYKLVHLDCNYGKLEQAKKKYGDKISIKDPGHVGSVVIASETDEFTVDKIINEFQIELLSDYFTRSLEYRKKYLE